jgi:hypothetical protein
MKHPKSDDEVSTHCTHPLIRQFTFSDGKVIQMCPAHGRTPPQGDDKIRGYWECTQCDTTRNVVLRSN